MPDQRVVGLPPARWPRIRSCHFAMYHPEERRVTDSSMWRAVNDLGDVAIATRRQANQAMVKLGRPPQYYVKFKNSSWVAGIVTRSVSEEYSGSQLRPR